MDIETNFIIRYLLYKEFKNEKLGSSSLFLFLHTSRWWLINLYNLLIYSPAVAFLWTNILLSQDISLCPSVSAWIFRFESETISNAISFCNSQQHLSRIHFFYVVVNSFTPTRYPTWLKKIQLAFYGVKTVSKESFSYFT